MEAEQYWTIRLFYFIFYNLKSDPICILHGLPYITQIFHVANLLSR